MQLFLTGGTGFFGKAILRKLLILAGNYPSQRPDRVVVLSRNPEIFLTAYPEFVGHDWLFFHKGDVEKQASLPMHESFTHVIHAAADSTNVPNMTHLKRYDQIVNGTRNMLDFSLRVGAKRFLLTSSGAVYGRQPENISQMFEDYCGMPNPVTPENSYGIAKRQAEHLCALYCHHHHLNIVIARCFAFVGPDLPMNAHFAIGNFIRDALFGDSIIVSGDGSPVRSYLYQDDLVSWLFCILEKGRVGDVYNVGSDQAFTIKSLAELVRDVVAPGKSILVGESKRDNANRNLYIPDITKAKQELGLRIETPLVDALRKTIQRLKA
jgi:dTDP-glucose 4,6-dehydratase